MSISNISGGGLYRGDRSERSEEDVIEIPPRESADSKLDAVALSALGEMAFGFTEPVAPRYIDIDRLDEQGNLLRYEIPRLSHSDYQKSVSEIPGYRSKCVCLFRYDPKIGCYAEIALGKTREQCEDDYEIVLEELNCDEKHAVWTDAPKNWDAVLQRRFNSTEYRKYSQERRAEQLDGIKKVVEYWRKQDLFAEVFAPDTRYREKVLGQYPEGIAPCDIIVLAYKRVPSVVRLWTATSWDGILTPIPSMCSEQSDRRLEADEASKSWSQKAMRKVRTSLPSIPWPRRESGPTTATVDPPLQIGPPPPPQEPTQTDEPEISFFFQEGGANGFVGVRLFRSVSRIARNIWDCLARLFDILRGRIGAMFAGNVVRSESAD